MTYTNELPWLPIITLIHDCDELHMYEQIVIMCMRETIIELSKLAEIYSSFNILYVKSGIHEMLSSSLLRIYIKALKSIKDTHKQSYIRYKN